MHNKCLQLISRTGELSEAVEVFLRQIALHRCVQVLVLQVKIPFNYICLLTGMVRGYCLLISIQWGLFMGASGKDFFAGTFDQKGSVTDSGHETFLCFCYIATVTIFFNGLLELHSHADVSLAA